MEPPSYMWSVIDQNVVMQHKTVIDCEQLTKCRCLIWGLNRRQQLAFIKDRMSQNALSIFKTSHFFGAI